MKALELRVPPPLVTLVSGALMWLIDHWLPGLQVELPGRHFVAGALALLGFFVAVAGVIEFRRVRTTVHPMKPENTSSLVTRGIYTRTRNPMYVGLAFVLLGWEVYLQNPVSFVVLPAFVLYMNRFQIVPEERILARIFGEAYTAYCAKVRRWL